MELILVFLFQNVESVKNPVHLKDLCKYDIDAIGFGAHHSAILTGASQVLSMGSNGKGQFGIGNTKARDVITVVKGLEDEQINVS